MEEDARRKKRAEQEKKVVIFTLVLGVLVAVGGLGGLLVGLLLNGGSLESNPFLPLVLSVAGLALALIVADTLTKKLLAKWIS